MATAYQPELGASANDPASFVATASHAPFEQAIGELRENQRELSQLVDQWFGDVDEQRSEVENRVQELESDNASARVSAAENLAELNACREQLAAANRQLAALQAENASLIANGTPEQAELATARAERESLRQQLQASQEMLASQQSVNVATSEAVAAQATAAASRAVEAECNELRCSLESARARIAQLAATETELAATTVQLSEARDEVSQWQARANSVHETDEIQSLQWRQWTLERRNLHSEIETLRRHAADLANSLAENRRQIIDERADWNAELRHLRRMLERQSQLLHERGGSVGAGGASGSEGFGRFTKLNDPALDAVMAQFSQMQHDWSRRAQSSSAYPPSHVPPHPPSHGPLHLPPPAEVNEG